MTKMTPNRVLIVAPAGQPKINRKKVTTVVLKSKQPKKVLAGERGGRPQATRLELQGDTYRKKRRAGLMRLPRDSRARPARRARNACRLPRLLRANLRLVKNAERDLFRALQDDPESESLQALLHSAQGQRRNVKSLLQQPQN